MNDPSDNVLFFLKEIFAMLLNAAIDRMENIEDIDKLMSSSVLDYHDKENGERLLLSFHRVQQVKKKSIKEIEELTSLVSIVSHAMELKEKINCSPKTKEIIH